jgi:hypothetical protein
MGNIIRLIPRAELERARLIREARAIYDSIFPPSDVDGDESDPLPAQWTPPPTSAPIALKKSPVKGE